MKFIGMAAREEGVMYREGSPKVFVGMYLFVRAAVRKYHEG